MVSFEFVGGLGIFFFLHSFLGIFKLLWSLVLPESLTSGSFPALPHTAFYDSLAYEHI